MIQFHETTMGHKFYNADVPRLIKAVEHLAAEQQKTNTLLGKLLSRMDPDDQSHTEHTLIE